MEQVPGGRGITRELKVLDESGRDWGESSQRFEIDVVGGVWHGKRGQRILRLPGLRGRSERPDILTSDSPGRNSGTSTASDKIMIFSVRKGQIEGISFDQNCFVFRFSTSFAQITLSATFHPAKACTPPPQLSQHDF